MYADNIDPHDRFPGTEWERIEGVFLLAATEGGADGGNSNASIKVGGTGGEAAHKLTISELASHTHIQNSHSHPQTTHSHGASYSGANFYIRHGRTAATDTVAGGTNTSINEGVGATWAGGLEYASYSHKIDRVNIGGTVSVTGANANISGQTATNQNTGEDSSHNNMPPYLSVNVWKRVA